MATKNEMVECPVCFKQFHSLEIQFHVQKCLDQQQLDEDRKLAQQIQHNSFNQIQNPQQRQQRQQNLPQRPQNPQIYQQQPIFNRTEPQSRSVPPIPSNRPPLPTPYQNPYQPPFYSSSNPPPLPNHRPVPSIPSNYQINSQFSQPNLIPSTNNSSLPPIPSNKPFPKPPSNNPNVNLPNNPQVTVFNSSEIPQSFLFPPTKTNSSQNESTNPNSFQFAEINSNNETTNNINNPNNTNNPINLTNQNFVTRFPQDLPTNSSNGTILVNSNPNVNNSSINANLNPNLNATINNAITVANNYSNLPPLPARPNNSNTPTTTGYMVPNNPNVIYIPVPSNYNPNTNNALPYNPNINNSLTYNPNANFVPPSSSTGFLPANGYTTNTSNNIYATNAYKVGQTTQPLFNPYKTNALPPSPYRSNPPPPIPKTVPKRANSQLPPPLKPTPSSSTTIEPTSSTSSTSPPTSLSISPPLNSTPSVLNSTSSVSSPLNSNSFQKDTSFFPENASNPENKEEIFKTEFNFDEIEVEQINIQEITKPAANDKQTHDLFKDYIPVLRNPTRYTKLLDADVIKRIKSSNYNRNLIRKFLIIVFKSEKHTFSKTVQHFSKVIRHNLTRELSYKINFSKHVSDFVSNFSNFIASYYEGVNDIDFLMEIVRDVVMSYLEIPLHEHYISKYAKVDARFTQKMLNFMTMSPAHFKIPSQFWLMESFAVESPYQSAADRLKKIENTFNFKEKFDILCSVNNEITNCIRIYYKNSKEKNFPTAIGADEFVPIFHWVFLKSGLRAPIAQFKFLEDFMVKTESLGESGYMLVTLHSALSFFGFITMKEIKETYEKQIEESRKRRSERTRKAIEEIDSTISIGVMRPSPSLNDSRKIEIKEENTNEISIEKEKKEEILIENSMNGSFDLIDQNVDKNEDSVTSEQNFGEQLQNLDLLDDSEVSHSPHKSNDKEESQVNSNSPISPEVPTFPAFQNMNSNVQPEQTQIPANSSKGFSETHNKENEDLLQLTLTLLEREIKPNNK